MSKYENYEIMFAVYGTMDGAAGAVDALKAMDKADTIDIVDAATLVKDEDGQVTVKQESLPSVRKGLGVGALIGGAIGLLFPPSILGAAAIGAGVGAGTAKLAKMALENDELKEAADQLEPGTSAFIAVVENTWAEKLQQTIAGYEKLAEHALDAEAAGVIGSIETDQGAAAYGTVAADGAAATFEAVTDGSTVEATATAVAVDADGNVVVDHVEGAVAADDAGDVVGAIEETVAVADTEGNVAVDHVESVIAADAEGDAAGIVQETVAVANAEGDAVVAQATDAVVAPAADEDDEDEQA